MSNFIQVFQTGFPNRKIISEYLFGYANRLIKTHKASTESVQRSLYKLQTILLGSLNAVPNFFCHFSKIKILHKHHLQKLHPNQTSHIPSKENPGFLKCLNHIKIRNIRHLSNFLKMYTKEISLLL